MNKVAEAIIKKNFTKAIEVKFDNLVTDKYYYAGVFYGSLAALRDIGVITSTEYDEKVHEFATAGAKAIMEKYGL